MAQVLKDSLVRLGGYVAQHGLRGEGPYRAARDLLLKEAPRVAGQELHREGETTVEAAMRLCGYLVHGNSFPIQGPRKVKILMRLPYGRNVATRQAVHGSAP